MSLNARNVLKHLHRYTCSHEFIKGQQNVFLKHMFANFLRIYDDPFFKGALNKGFAGSVGHSHIIH